MTPDSEAPTSWFADDVYDALKAAGAALCLSEREDNAPPPLVETAPWGYVRLRLETYGDDDRQWLRSCAHCGPCAASSISVLAYAGAVGSCMK